MKKGVLRLLALFLTLCMLLCGCGRIGEYLSLLGGYLFGTAAIFQDMEYLRPDMDAFRQSLDDACQSAETETDFQSLLQLILQFNAAYDQYATAHALSMIHYCRDMTDTYWEAEYDFCQQISTEVSAGVDKLYRLLAKSSLRPQLESADYFGADFFVAYEGESLYDETFTAFLQQETELVNQYYDLYAAAGDLAYDSQEFAQQYGAQMADLLVELVLLRQQLSAHAGYDSYADFAYAFYYSRDFSPADATAYLADIRTELVPLYQSLGTGIQLDITLYACDQEETFDYVSTAANAMGGMIAQAFDDMTRYELYDIAPGENKYNASFEIYISGYQLPYIFLNPTETEQDKLTFAHEFGHFCNDHASYGSMAGIDVAEIFSQGMEYLSLSYGCADENLVKLKMLDCLCVYVEQSALASFEHQLYALPADQVTVETMDALYRSTCASFGIEGSYGYYLITHLYTNPMYIISYVVSNDAALQIYQLEQAETGAGLACYRENLIPWKTDLLAFLEQAGLESPFAEDRLQAVKATLENALK